MVEYKNRYGDIFTFEINERGNVDWKGNFEWLRFGYANDPGDILTVDPSGGPYISVGDDMDRFGLEGKVVGFISQEYGYELVIEPCEVCEGKTHHKLTCQNNPNKQPKVKLTEGNELSNIKVNPPENKNAPPPPAPQPSGYPYEFMNKHGWAAGIKPKYIPKPNTMEETIEVPKQLISDMLADMEKNSLSQHNNGWGADWPLTLEEFIEQGKMSKYYYELRKLLPKT